MASDLANHLACRHLTALDLEAAHGRLSPPTWRDPALEVLQRNDSLVVLRVRQRSEAYD